MVKVSMKKYYPEDALIKEYLMNEAYINEPKTESFESYYQELETLGEVHIII
jgi:hypothetical protein